jgi:outer membrane lipoprotein carrier protein
MKVRFNFILFALFNTLFSLSIYAQYDQKAASLLDEVSKKYEEIKSYKANFVYELENTQAKLNEKFNGEINVKGNKFNLKLGTQEIFNNGTTVWTFLKDENEVNVSDYSPDEDEISPTKIYSIYKQGYKYLLGEEEKLKGVSFQTVDLVPENKKKTYFKIRLWINKKEKSISCWKIFEKNGNRYLYTVSNFQANIKIDDSAFNFDKTKYKGVEVIDLR